MDPVDLVAAQKLEDFAARAHPEDALKWSLYSGDYVHLRCLGPMLLHLQSSRVSEGSNMACQAWRHLQKPTWYSTHRI